MSERPFQCVQCHNWYIAVPMEADTFCVECDQKKHAIHPSKGTYDCHWGHMSAVRSEIDMALLLNQIAEVEFRAGLDLTAIQEARTKEEVTSILTNLEQALAKMERDAKNAPNIVTWAAVKELPGTQGESPKVRFKHIDAIADLVANNRRPQTDMEELRRAMTVCAAMAEDAVAAQVQARMAANEVRRAAMDWTVGLADQVENDDDGVRDYAATIVPGGDGHAHRYGKAMGSECKVEGCTAQRVVPFQARQRKELATAKT